MTGVISLLRTRYPDEARHLADLARMDAHRSANPPVPLVELSTIMSGESEPKARPVLSAALCSSWAQHTAYATRARLAALERAVLAAVAGREALVAGILGRAHLEAAGVAAYAVNELNRSMAEHNPKTLSNVVGATLFGTSLKRLAKKDDVAKALLEPGAQDTLEPSAVVAALDKFSPDKRQGAFAGRWYSILCDYAHPNLRGTKDYCTVLSQTGDEWLLRYDAEGQFTSAHAALFLEVLAYGSRNGTAASEFLLSTRFAEDGSRLEYRPPSQHALRRVYELACPTE